MKNSRIKKLIDHVVKSLEKADVLTSQISKEVLLIEGMSGIKTRHLYNNLCSIKDIRLLEIGCWKGSTSCSALCNNNIKATFIDNWSTPYGRRSLRECFLANVNQFRKGNKIDIIEKDCWDVDRSGLDKYNIYVYDGDHSYDATYKGLGYFLECLDDEFIYIVDDYNEPHIKSATLAAISDFNLVNHLEREILSAGNPGIQAGGLSLNEWHNGICIFVLEKRKDQHE